LFQAKDLPALDEDASNVFSKSERLLLDHATKRFKTLITDFVALIPDACMKMIAQ